MEIPLSGGPDVTWKALCRVDLADVTWKSLCQVDLM